MIKPFEICPRFPKCNVNKCPLHLDFLKLESSEYDRAVKCTLSKSIRKKLGGELAHKGLTQRELSGAKRWNSLSLEEQEARRQKGRENSLFLRLSRKGYKIVPSNNINSVAHEQNKEKTLQQDISSIIQPKMREVLK